MSTRCQVHVHNEGLHYVEKLTLYHHTDGYPSYMLPILAKAHELSGGGWEAGRTGKVASYMCAADPGIFEPEEGHELHSDIEYYYDVAPVNEHGGSMAEEDVVWRVKVYKRHARAVYDRELTLNDFTLESEHVIPERKGESHELHAVPER